MTSSFVNQSFYSRISFNLDFTLYISTRKQLQIAKIEIITNLNEKNIEDNDY